MSAFPDMVVTMDSLDREGGDFVYRWTLTGTNSGPSGTGNRVHISGYEEWILGANGLLAHSLGHFDEVDFQQQIENGVTDPGSAREKFDA